MTTTHATPRVRLEGGYSEVVHLAFPVILSMTSQTVMSAVEAAFLGYIGTVEQGAAGLGNALLWSFFIACNCIGIGVQIGVAQARGAQRHLECGAITWQGLYASALAWLLLLAAGLCAPLLVQFSAPSPELIAPTTIYLQIALLGGLPALLNVTLVGFFRGLGDTRTPLAVTLAVELLNVLLDVLLIFGYAGCPRLGVAGAALASVSASAAGTALYMGLFLHRGRRDGLLARRRIPFHRHTCWRLLQMSWPIGAQGALEMSAWTFFTALIARFGAVEVAAHTIAVRILSLSYMAGYGIAVACTTQVGQYLGAQNRPAARRSMMSCLVLVTLLMGILGVGVVVWRFPLVRLFTHDPAVVSLGVQVLICVALLEMFDGVGVVATGALRGAGDTRWPMLVGLVLNWLVFVPSAMLAMFTWQGGMIEGWYAALGCVSVLGIMMVLRVLRHAFGHARAQAVGNDG
jgi:MATE family multidrug resistance protein